MRPRKDLRIVLCCLLLVVLSGCELWPQSTVTSEPQSTTVPDVQLSAPPEVLCRDATQLRLQPVVSEGMLDAPFQWELRAAGADPVLASGEWSSRQRELVIPFPVGQLLAPGEYALSVVWEEEVVAGHEFTILAQGPELTAATLALTPVGPETTNLELPPRIFYLRYEYEFACRGAPFWVTVNYGDELVCSRNIPLPEEHGQGVVACYRQTGAFFEAGEYQATLTLLGGEERTLTFRVGQKPVEMEPVVYHPVCEPATISMGLTPTGEPYRPLERFEWYAQSIYLSAQCRDLPPELGWAARWYRDGEEFRVYEGRRQGAEEGFIWDSITGVERTPFLLPGYYTATLSIADTVPLTVAFRLIPYVPAEE